MAENLSTKFHGKSYGKNLQSKNSGIIGKDPIGSSVKLQFNIRSIGNSNQTLPYEERNYDSYRLFAFY